MRHNDQPQQYFNRRPMVTGAAIAATGGLLTMVGVLVSAFAALAGARAWVRHLDQPPGEVAKVKWHQARAAGTAGADAWRHSAVHPSRAS